MNDEQKLEMCKFYLQAWAVIAMNAPHLVQQKHVDMVDLVKAEMKEIEARLSNESPVSKLIRLDA